ncbi:MAG: hypothetical protein ACRDQA_16960 [Nocardioidaceae bacterium]
MLDLRRRGLDVEGVDSSADMLARCRHEAARKGIDVVVHHQRMERLDLPRSCRSSYPRRHRTTSLVEPRRLRQPMERQSGCRFVRRVGTTRNGPSGRFSATRGMRPARAPWWIGPGSCIGTRQPGSAGSRRQPILKRPSQAVSP